MNFNYNTDQDQEVYIEDNIVVSGVHTNIKSTTVAGSTTKSNEDSFAIRIHNDCLWIAVFDGTTSLKETPNIEGSGARFASHFLKESFYNINLTNPTDILIELNKKLLEKSVNLGGNLSDTHSLPASMGTIVQVDFERNKLFLSHVGDTYAILYAQDGSSRIITDDKNKKFDDEMFALMKRVAREREISNREARQDGRVHKDLYEMFIKRNNNPDGTGSGIINGDPNMEKYIYENTLSITNMESILVASDGFEIQGSSVEDETFRKEIKEIIAKNGMKELISKKKQSEDDDPDWKNIRYKHSDDATAVLCTFT